MGESSERKVDITIAVVPREKFSYCRTTLDALLENTSLPFKLIYIDGGSPHATRDYIRKKLEGRPDTRLLRYERFFGPFQSRNIAIREADPETKYLVILDNDVFVRPGWLESLYRCAEEEQADAIVPLVLLGASDTDEIHHAGGDSGVKTAASGEREFEHRQRFEYHQAADVADELRRGPTTLLEDHCIFAPTAIWKQIELDERLPLMSSVPEISAQFHKTGQKLLLEPEARVVYMWGAGAPIHWSDVPTWYLAWSNKWSRFYMREMANKYGAKSIDQIREVNWWMGNHRRVGLFPLMDGITRLFGKLHLGVVGKILVKTIEKIEDGVSYLIAEAVRLTPAGRATGCPSLFTAYPAVRPQESSNAPAGPPTKVANP
jgi:GT2 family glycosyltransferase